MSKYIDRAKALRAIEVPHYNCAQAVVVPFAEEAGLSEQMAMVTTLWQESCTAAAFP